MHPELFIKSADTSFILLIQRSFQIIEARVLGRNFSSLYIACQREIHTLFYLLSSGALIQLPFHITISLSKSSNVSGK